MFCYYKLLVKIKHNCSNGNLAIIIKTEVKNGDLVAVNELDSDLASIGFYDNQFGLVCLDDFSAEPDLFNETQIQIMGRVVGVAEPQINAAGRYTVKPISTEIK